MQTSNFSVREGMFQQMVLVAICLALVASWALIASVASAQSNTGTISGTKWNDVDGDGKLPSGTSTEAPLSGWTIYLDTNNNGHLDSGEPNRVTDGDGNYSFEGLALGFYTVREVQQAGWVQTAPASVYYLVEIKSDNLTHRGMDFGNKMSGDTTLTGSISGMKWEDKDGDGKLPSATSTEGGLAGVTIYLDLNSNGNLDSGEPTTTTNADGGYKFEGLAPGTYIVREVVQSGWKQTSPSSGFYNLSLSIASTSMLNHLGVDFGNQRVEQGGGGGGGGGGPAPVAPTPTPTPSPAPTPVPPPPGQVLGEDKDVGGAEGLPRTGLSENALFVLALLGVGYVIQSNKKKAVA